MKHNQMMIICLISLLVVVFSGCTSQELPVAAATPETTLQLVKQGNNVEIHMDNVVNLYGLDIHIKFDPTKIQIQDADPETEGIQVVPGDLPAPDFVAFNTVDNEQGLINYTVVQTSPRKAASGSGIVAIIQVQEGITGNDAFTVIRAELADPDGNMLPVRVKDISEM